MKRKKTNASEFAKRMIDIESKMRLKKDIISWKVKKKRWELDFLKKMYKREILNLAVDHHI